MGKYTYTASLVDESISILKRADQELSGTSAAVLNAVNTILNAILSIEMIEMATLIKEGNKPIDVIRSFLNNHKRVIFNGDGYSSEWEENSDWLKLSFHSDFENVKPYEFSEYDEVYQDVKKINNQILRFASPASLAKTTTVHYCLATPEGLNALSDNAVLGLLGLFGTKEEPRTSYGIEENKAQKIRDGETVKVGKISYASIDIVLNSFSKENILVKLNNLINHNCIRVMIHEQYFYADYKNYQPDFEEKLRSTFSFLNEHCYESRFFEDLI